MSKEKRRDRNKRIKNGAVAEFLAWAVSDIENPNSVWRQHVEQDMRKGQKKTLDGLKEAKIAQNTD